MASWLFGASKLKTDNIVESELLTTSPVPVSSNTVPVTNDAPTTPNLLYSLQPDKPKTSDENVKVTSMLDSIPFVLSNQIDVNTNNLNYTMEATKKCLLSVKELLESDVYNYDFSNDRKLVRDHNMYIT